MTRIMFEFIRVLVVGFLVYLVQLRLLYLTRKRLDHQILGVYDISHE
jgi:hypothetical protein